MDQQAHKDTCHICLGLASNCVLMSHEGSLSFRTTVTHPLRRCCVPWVSEGFLGDTITLSEQMLSLNNKTRQGKMKGCRKMRFTEDALTVLLLGDHLGTSDAKIQDRDPSEDGTHLIRLQPLA